jgi:hypothetical protein
MTTSTCSPTTVVMVVGITAVVGLVALSLREAWKARR